MSQVTVTGTAGAGVTVTALVITDVSSFTIETDKEMLTVVANGQYKNFDISAATTITVSVSGSNYTVEIS